MKPEITQTTPTIPDPWELTNSTPKAIADETWQIPVEAHPLICPAGDPNALQLTTPKSNPVQVLLQDWLKLKRENAKTLTTQFQEALGLLYWIGWAT